MVGMKIQSVGIESKVVHIQTNVSYMMVESKAYMVCVTCKVFFAQ